MLEAWLERVAADPERDAVGRTQCAIICLVMVLQGLEGSRHGRLEIGPH